MSDRPRILIVRGDLRSYTGYSRALRAHVAALAPSFDQIVGVDIYFHPATAHTSFQGEILSSEKALALSEDPQNQALVLNYCMPEDFQRFPRAKNVGLFYWETDRFHPDRNWDSFIHLMDEIWIPAENLRPLIERTRFRGPIRYFPWPQQMPGPVSTSSIRVIPLRSRSSIGYTFLRLSYIALKRFRPCKKVIEGLLSKIILSREVPLAQIRSSSKTVFGSMFQEVARKGPYLLLSDWLHFLKKDSGNADVLILKISPLPDKSSFDVLLSFENMLQRLTHSSGVLQPNVFLITSKLSDDELEEFYASIDALVSTTLGEGFGGPMVEAAFRKKAVIAPRHTSLADILPFDYPLNIPYRMLNVSLATQLEFYCYSSQWGVINPRAMSERLELFSEMTTPLREDLCSRLHEHCKRKFLFDNVQTAFAKELEGLWN